MAASLPVTSMLERKCLEEQNEANLTEISQMIDEGASVNLNHRMSGAPTLLFNAVDNGKHELVRLLLEHGAHVELRPIGRPTPLGRAVGFGFGSMGLATRVALRVSAVGVGPYVTARARPVTLTLSMAGLA